MLSEQDVCHHCFIIEGNMQILALFHPVGLYGATKSWGRCESDLSDMLSNEGHKDSCPQCCCSHADARAWGLSEEGGCRRSCPGRWGEEAKLCAFRPMHQDAADGDATRARPSACPQSGQGRGNAHSSLPRGATERCHCWSPAWPLSWLLGWWSDLVRPPLLWGQGALGRPRWAMRWGGCRCMWASSNMWVSSQVVYEEHEQTCPGCGERVEAC